MDKPVASAPTGAKEKVEKQARQLAYDVRYKTKQSMAKRVVVKWILHRFRKAYMSQLAKSPAPPAVKARAKQMLMGENYKKVGKLVLIMLLLQCIKYLLSIIRKMLDGNTILMKVKR